MLNYTFGLSVLDTRPIPLNDLRILANQLFPLTPYFNIFFSPLRRTSVVDDPEQGRQISFRHDLAWDEKR